MRMRTLSKTALFEPLRGALFRLAQVSRPRLACALVASSLLCGLGPSPAVAAPPLTFATRLQVSREAETTLVKIRFTRTPTYMARLGDGKRRLIVDVMNADVRGVPPTYSKAEGGLRSVLTQSFASGDSRTTRILVNLSEAAQAEVSVDGESLVVQIRPAPVAPLQPAAAARVGASAAAAKPVVSHDETAVPSGDAKPAESESAPDANLIRDVAYEHRQKSDAIKILVSEHGSYEQDQPAPGKSRLVVHGVRLAEGLERTLDARAFRGGVDTIHSSFDEEQKAVVIEVERRANVRSSVSERRGYLLWTFFAPGSLHSSMTGVGSDGGIARKARTLHVDDPLAAGLPAIDSGDERGPGSDTFEQSVTTEAAAFAANLQDQSGYAGRRIDLDLKDADVHNVLRLLADVGKVNIVTADNVGGSVTIRMRNVPWDQALSVVLQSKGLGMVRRGNIIRVAPLPQLEKEREMAIARRRQELQLAPLETRLIPVSYADAEQVQLRAREVLSGRGTVAVDGRTNVLIARDVSGTLDQVEELVRSLDTQTPQVLVEARVVEATSRYLRDIGIQWGGDASFSASTGNATGLAFPSAIGLAGGASDNDTPTAGLSPFQAQVQNPNFVVNMPATVGTGSGGAIGLTLGSVDSNFNLNLRLSAAESSGMVRILSSPRILTLDNHEARISQGTLIPFSQVSAQGVQTTFQEAKLQLMVQPHVTADGSVAMHVKINRDEPDFNQTSARGDPTILKREAETDLLVMDGHTAVIGGIYTRNTGRNVDQVPFFGDIPLLGLLFQSRQSSDQRGELVIFLTPRIVNRAQALGR